MLDALLRPAPGAAPVLDLGAMMGARAPASSLNVAAGASTSAGVLGVGTGDGVEQAEQPRGDPARSLMGAIAKGLVLQQQKERHQAQVVPCARNDVMKDSMVSSNHSH